MNMPEPDQGIMFLVFGAIEFAKTYLPDKIEGKVLPVLAILTGGILGYFYMDILTGITSGMVCTGLVHVAKGLAKPK